MKKLTNIIATIFVIVLLKGCIIAPLWLCVDPFVTAYQWGGMSKLRYSIPFCFKSVWHTLSTDWQDGCAAFIYNLNK